MKTVLGGGGGWMDIKSIAGERENGAEVRFLRRRSMRREREESADE
jgi:hypothetical protein